MEAAIPNLLVRTVSDPIDSPFSHLPSRESSPERDHAGAGALSFRAKAGAGGGGAGGAGSPLSLSPRSLHLEVKERKDVLLRGFPEDGSMGANNGRSRSGSVQDWADGVRDGEGGEGFDRSRLLSLGIWTEETGKEQGTVADIIRVLGQGGNDQIAGANGGGAATITAGAGHARR